MEKVIKNKFINKVNYILKFYKEENEIDQSYIIDKKCIFNFINDTSLNQTYHLLYLKNNYEKKNESYYYNYTYILRLYLKKYIYEDQQLNTTALISYNNKDNYYNYFEHITDDPNEDIPYLFPNLLFNEEYILYLFVKINGKNGEEKYYSNYFNIDTKYSSEKKPIVNNNGRLILILSISLGFAIIIFIIITIICIRIRNKNKNLEEKVNAISFSSGIDSDEIINNNRVSKTDEDYESTFI